MESLYSVIQQCPAPSDDPSDWSALLYVRETLLPALPRCNYILLSHVLRKRPTRLLEQLKLMHCIPDLMHEVSLRSSTNLMDAHNLTIVLCPNLVSSSSPLRDVMMCSIPGGPALHSSLPTSNATQDGRTTLGMIIKLCIQRYYEVFDEIQDRSEALPPARSFDDEVASSSGSSSPRLPNIPSSPNVAQKRLSMLSKGSSNRDSRGFDDDDSIDDAMLVMPIGPPSAWGTPSATTSTGTFRPRHRTGLSGGGSQSQIQTQVKSSARSMHTMGNGNGNGTGYGTVGKARSTISIDKGAAGTMRKGSISVGRGTRKASGAAVEAVGVTASGFFSPPSSAPPVPPVPSRNGLSQDSG